MIYILYGAGGMLAVLGLLALGIVIGWNGNNAFQKYSRRKVEEEATEEQKRRERAAQAFYDEMLSYSADQAYNMGGDTFGG